MADYMRELCVIEGDGIGHEVVPAAVEVLKTALPDIDVVHHRAGWQTFQETGISLSNETIDAAQQCTAVLFGAATSPSYPVEGYFSPIVRLRRVLNTHANIRPTSFLPVPTARSGVNLIVVRENTEDVYVIDEQSDNNVSTAMKVITRAASERVAHTAFRLAQQAGRNRVTIVHKANVLAKTDGLFRQVALDVAEGYIDIEVEDMLIDTAAYWMVKDPSRFDIILTLNQYGDILSDMAAAWGGGLGLAPALNIGEGVAIAEPVHGSAPDIAGKGIANPTAAILSLAMLVRYHWKMPIVSDHIWEAVRRTCADGYFTADIDTTQWVTTERFVQEVCRRLS